MSCLLFFLCKFFFSLLLMNFENFLCFLDKSVPGTLLIVLQMDAHSSEVFQDLLDTAVNVRSCRTHVWSQDMRSGVNLLFEVPCLLVRTQLVLELTLFVLLLANQDWVLFVVLLVLGVHIVELSFSLLKQSLLNLVCNGDLEVALDVSLVLEAFQQDEVFDIFKHMRVDPSQHFSATQPLHVVIFIIIEVAFPDPGSL